MRGTLWHADAWCRLWTPRLVQALKATKDDRECKAAVDRELDKLKQLKDERADAERRQVPVWPCTLGRWRAHGCPAGRRAGRRPCSHAACLRSGMRQAVLAALQCLAGARSLSLAPAHCKPGPDTCLADAGRLPSRPAAVPRRHAVVGGIQRLPDRRAIDYREDFFGKAAFLTVRRPLHPPSSGSLGTLACMTGLQLRWQPAPERRQVIQPCRRLNAPGLHALPCTGSGWEAQARSR